MSQSSLPAVLGGSPAFEESIPFVRPAMPPLEPLEAEAHQILASGMLTKGNVLRRFEHAVAEHLGVKHAVGVSSCTTGLMLTYRCLGLTGEVVVPSFTFMATVSAMVWTGLRPVYVDVRRGTTNIDPEAAERAITPRTSAIVGVHNFGNPAEIDALVDIARRHRLKLVFDAAHGFGARYQGTPVGGQGDAHCFSMSPTKLLVAGEGGIVSTNDDALAAQIRCGREYGNDGNYDSAFAGMNARLAEFNALLGLHSLSILEDVAQRRNEVARRYSEGLAGVPGLEFIEVLPGDRSSYKDFSILVDAERFGMTRDRLAEALAAERIDTRKYYAPAVHEQTAYRHFCTGREELPNTIALAEGSLSLPIGTHLTDELISRVCGAVRRIHEHADAIAAEPASAGHGG